ncbi:MAG: carboxypeptidase-like regulatory domain-containing protein [Planctomycetota bacterium]
MKVEKVPFQTRAAKGAAFLLTLILLTQSAAAFLTSLPAHETVRETWTPAAAESREEMIEVANAAAPAVRSVTTVLLTILNSDGFPVCDANIFARTEVSSFESVSNEDGDAAVVVPASRDIILTIVSAGYEILETTLSSKHYKTKSEFRLQKLSPLRGKVVDASGEPVVGASVFFVALREFGAERIQTILPDPIVSDINGEFEFSHAPRFGVKLQIRKPGYVGIESGPGELAANRNVNDDFQPSQAAGAAAEIHFCLIPAATIEGFIVDSQKRGLSQVSLVVVDLDHDSGPAPTVCTGVSSPTGSYRLTEVPPNRRVAVRALTSNGPVDSEIVSIPAFETRELQITIRSQPGARNLAR